MMAAIVVISTIVISVLAVVTNTPRAAWQSMADKIKKDWEEAFDERPH